MKDSYWVSIISLLIISPRLISEYLFRFTPYRYVWVFRIIDVFDLTLQTLSFIVLVYYVYSRYVYGESKGFVFFFVLLAMFLLGGHFMHSTANAIDMSYRETVGLNPEEAMPSVTYELVHFLDEYLSHIIMFVSLYLILLLGGLMSVRIDRNFRRGSLIVAGFWGFIVGGGLGISLVEASIAPLMMIFVPVEIIVILVYTHKRGIGIEGLLRKEFSLYVIIVFVFTLVSMFAYVAVFGFYSPRELIGSYLAGG